MNKKPLLDFISCHSPASSAVIDSIAVHFEEKILSKNDFFLRETPSVTIICSCQMVFCVLLPLIQTATK